MKTKKLTESLYWIGNLDPDLKIFDIVMQTEYGTSYNSYLLKGSKKTAIFETAKVQFFDKYISKIQELIEIKDIDYIILDHTEPDHTGSIEKLLKINPKIKVVGSSAAINFTKEITNLDFNSIIVKDQDTLSLGDKTLKFISAPNLHWPDTIFTYIEEEKTLMTCDAFGAHFSYEGITDEDIPNREEYISAVKYYYDHILAPFTDDYLSAIEKIEDLDINIIGTGHGPVLIKYPMEIVKMSKAWASQTSPYNKKMVVIPYVSAYGYTKMLADKISEGIKEAGDIEVIVLDMVEEEQSRALELMAFADGILLGTPTMVGDALAPIWNLATSMFARIHGGKIVSAFGSYGWSGEGVLHILDRLSQLRVKIYGTEGYRVRFKPSDAELTGAFEFGYGFGCSVLEGKIIDPDDLKGKETLKAEGVTKWKCLVCGEIVEGLEPPEACPVCNVGPDKFEPVIEKDTEFESDKEDRIVIIGNGAASIAAIEEIRQRNKSCYITVIGKEDIIAYHRPMLTKNILSNLDEPVFSIKTKEWYEENSVNIILSEEVVKVDTDSKTVFFKDDSAINYDRLIFATGASSFIPPIDGHELEGVMSIRDIEDVRKLQNRLQKSQEVAIIGGGVLGLEAAWEIQKTGKQVSVIELAPYMMAKQLDEKGSDILRKAVESSGVKCYIGTGIEKITGEKEVEGVKLNNGETVKAQIVILSTGVRANINVAKSAGIDTDRNIIVNENMETNIEGVYACGDCAEFDGVNYAIIPQAVGQGKVAGANAAGDNLTYRHETPVNYFSGFNTKLFAIGDNGKDKEKVYKEVEVTDPVKKHYKKMYFVNNRFVGGILIGDISESGLFTDAFQDQYTMERML